MAVKVVVRNNKQIIVPLRFGRAVDGAPVIDAPDVDDRGFAMGNRPGTWGSTNARGAMVGITAGDTVRIKLRREDIDDFGKLKLFATSSDTNVVTVVDSDQQIGAEGIFSIKGLVDVISTPVKIQIHMNSTTGPVLAEMEPHIFQLRQLRTVAHLVTITGAGGSVKTTRTAQDLVDLFNQVNAIWRAAGVEFTYNPAEIRDGAADTIHLATAGIVTTNLAAGQAPEFDRLMNLNKANGAVNVYCVHGSQDPSGWDGLTSAKDANPAAFGSALVDGEQQGQRPLGAQASAMVLAHELGHYLDLQHYNENAAGTTVRSDIWTERRLMDAAFPSQDPPYHFNVGYGDGQQGVVIDLKCLRGDPTDGDLAVARRRSLDAV